MKDNCPSLTGAEKRKYCTKGPILEEIKGLL